MRVRATNEAARLAESWRLAFAETPRRGLQGARLGKGTGASLEFEDRRSYSAGDDVRHLDWRAYARTGEMMVKLHREEVSPRVEILLDTSRSMAAGVGGEAKAQLAVDLAALFLRSALSDGFAPVLFVCRDVAEKFSLERFEGEGVEIEARTELNQVLHGAAGRLRAGASRVLISDLLFPSGAEAVIRTVASGGGGLAIVQTLSAEDATPVAGRALRLIDAETGEAVEHVLDEASVRRYLDRLARLERGAQEQTRRFGGSWARVVADRPLEEVCRQELARAGILDAGS
ncbi:MAG: DUF58 domain-containing protein [Planctomycetota bacterium]